MGGNNVDEKTKLSGVIEELFCCVLFKNNVAINGKVVSVATPVEAYVE